jgi:hypothetical protein
MKLCSLWVHETKGNVPRGVSAEEHSFILFFLVPPLLGQKEEVSEWYGLCAGSR